MGKKLVIIFSGLFLVELHAALVEVSCPNNVNKEWNQDFCYKARIWGSYKFGDYIKNTNNKPIRLTKYDKPPIFNNDTKYNGWDRPTFSLTQQLMDAKWIIEPWKSMKYIESLSYYKIKGRPYNWISSYDNIKITFKDYIKFYNPDTNKTYWSESAHTEVMHIAVTWCGDGNLDTEYWESCDPLDTKSKGWCSNTCEKLFLKK